MSDLIASHEEKKGLMPVTHSPISTAYHPESGYQAHSTKVGAKPVAPSRRNRWIAIITAILISAVLAGVTLRKPLQGGVICEHDDGVGEADLTPTLRNVTSLVARGGLDERAYSWQQVTSNGASAVINWGVGIGAGTVGGCAVAKATGAKLNSKYCWGGAIAGLVLSVAGVMASGYTPGKRGVEEILEGLLPLNESLLALPEDIKKESYKWRLHSITDEGFAIAVKVENEAVTGAAFAAKSSASKGRRAKGSASESDYSGDVAYLTANQGNNARAYYMDKSQDDWNILGEDIAQKMIGGLNNVGGEGAVTVTMNSVCVAPIDSQGNPIFASWVYFGGGSYNGNLGDCDYNLEQINDNFDST